jgi:hypothetical protein
MDFETPNSNSFFPKKRKPNFRSTSPVQRKIIDLSPEAFSPHKSIFEKIKHLEIKEELFRDILAARKRDLEAIEILLIIILYTGKAPYFRLKYLELLEGLLPYLPRTAGEVELCLKSMRFDRNYEGTPSRSLAAKALSQLVDGDKLISIIIPLLTNEWEPPELRLELIEVVSSIRDPRIGLAMGGIFTSKRANSRLRQKAMWGLVKEHEYHKQHHPAVFEALKAIIRDEREEAIIRSTCADVLGLMKELFPPQQIIHSALYDSDFVFTATINAVKRLQTEKNIISVLTAITEIHRIYPEPRGKTSTRLHHLGQITLKYDLLGLLVASFNPIAPLPWQPHLINLIELQGAVNLSKLNFLVEANKATPLYQILIDLVHKIQPVIQNEEKMKILL